MGMWRPVIMDNSAISARNLITQKIVEHLSVQLSKAYPKTSALRRIRRFIPLDVMMTLYKTFIAPHFEYCSPLLVGLGKVQCNRLEDANYSILRLLLGHAKSVPYEQLLTITDMSNLRQRRISQSLVLLYKCLYCNGPHAVYS